MQKLSGNRVHSSFVRYLDPLQGFLWQGEVRDNRPTEWMQGIWSTVLMHDSQENPESFPHPPPGGRATTLIPKRGVSLNKKYNNNKNT